MGEAHPTNRPHGRRPSHSRPTAGHAGAVLKGVGPERAELLRLGLHTARDVLFFFPRDYQDLTDQREVDQLEEGKLQSVRGVVEDVDFAAPRRRRLHPRRAGPLPRPATSAALWFNQPLHARAVHAAASG